MLRITAVSRRKCEQIFDIGRQRNVDRRVDRVSAFVEGLRDHIPNIVDIVVVVAFAARHVIAAAPPVHGVGTVAAHDHVAKGRAEVIIVSTAAGQRQPGCQRGIGADQAVVATVSSAVRGTGKRVETFYIAAIV